MPTDTTGWMVLVAFTLLLGYVTGVASTLTSAAVGNWLASIGERLIALRKGRLERQYERVRDCRIDLGILNTHLLLYGIAMAFYLFVSLVALILALVTMFLEVSLATLGAMQGEAKTLDFQDAYFWLVVSLISVVFAMGRYAAGHFLFVRVWTFDAYKRRVENILGHELV